MKPLYWSIRNLFKTYFKIFYRHKVFGIEHLIEGRAIIAPNHTSFFDPPIVAISENEEIYFLARKSLFTTPILGKLISHLNAYPVSQSAQELSSLKLICHLLEKNKKVVIFPEGSRSTDGSFQPIKSGIGMLSMRSSSPIIPVYIDGAHSVWNRHHKFPKMTGKTACIFGSPIFPENFTSLKKKEAQEAISLEVKNAIVNLKRWYEDGAKGLPP